VPAVSDLDTAVVAGGIALAGGFLGQLVYARRVARAAHQDDQRERLRQERLLAYSDYAGSLIEFRRLQLARWFAERDDRAEPTRLAALIDDARKQRARTLEGYFRITLIADAHDIEDCAKQAFDCANTIHDAPGREAVIRQADRLRDVLVPAFIKASAKEVQVATD
jgi:hypothetical protein